MNPDDLIVLAFLQISDPGLPRFLDTPLWMLASEDQIDLWSKQKQQESVDRRTYNLLILKENS